MTDNKYEFKKTISFKIVKEHVNKEDTSFQLPEALSKDDLKRKISIFIEKMETVSENVKLLFFFDKETESQEKKYANISFTRNLEIKYPWLKEYTKRKFHDFLKEKEENNSKPKKKYVLGDVSYLACVFKERINDWLDIINRLKELNKAPLENQRRKREFAVCFKQLRKRSNLEFMREFVKAIHNSNKTSYQNYDMEINVDERLESLDKQIGEIEKELKSLFNALLPAETLGLELLRATFNYHTLNKTPNEYGDDIEQEIEALDKQIPQYLFKRIDYYSKKTLFDCSENWFKEICFSKNQNWTLNTAYKEIKKWKAEKKKEFMEAIDKIKDVNEFTDEKHGEMEKDHPLFKSDKEQMKLFIERSISIEELSTIKNKIKDKKNLTEKEHEILSKSDLKKNSNEIQEKIVEIKKIRGSFFNFTKGKIEIITKNYYELCELFKRIAQKKGKILAKKKALDYEKIDAELLTHWAFILEEDKKHSLVLVPRSQGDGRSISCAKKFIDEQNNKTGDKILCLFQSLTLRALEKLCFKEHDNTFRREIKKELKNYPKFKRELYEKISETDGDKRLISFYQKVLGTNHAKREVSKYRHMTEITAENYGKSEDPLTEFRKDLEKCCYIKRIVGNEDVLHQLKSKYNASVFLIDSLDLRTERQNTPEQIEKYKKKHEKREMNLLRTEHNKNTQKRHTLLWKEFWKDDNEHDKYPTRLNPELRIFFREPRDSRIKKYGEASGSYDINKKNRFLTPQYTLATTFTLNSTNKNLDFSWDDKEKIKKKLDRFNREFAQNNANRWVYGIDRGLKQSATLCIVDLDKEKPDFPEIPLYELNKNKYHYQDENKNSFGSQDKGLGGPIKNISNFIDKIDDEEWFSKSSDKKNACIDLTTAKVIKGCIIKNGDVQTLLNLKEISAKRKIYQLFNQGKIDKNFEVARVGNKAKTLKIAYKSSNEQQEDSSEKTEEKDEYIELYWLSKEQQNSFEEKVKPVVNELNQYLKKIDSEPPLEKINHLRDSIAANMIGVIKFLHDKFPAKRIALENLDEPHPTEKIRFTDFHFLNQSNQHISRRLEWALYRKFQNEGLVPPNVKETILLKDEFKQTQFGIVQFVETKGTSSDCPNCDFCNGKSKGHYKCKSCGFSSTEKGDKKGLVPLTDSDKVAAYNVAKKTIEREKITQAVCGSTIAQTHQNQS